MQSPCSVEFDFNSGGASPIIGSSPSTPKGFGDYYLSTPTTPTHANFIYQETDDHFHNLPSNFSYYPISFEPKSKPRVQTLKSLWCAFSPKRYKDQSNHHHHHQEQERGRLSSASAKTRMRKEGKATRSLSPVRKIKYPWEEEELNLEGKDKKQLSSKGSRKWKFKDLFLFRSASEGRAYDKDPLKKYTYFHRKQQQEAGKTTGLRQHVSTQGQHISAHELHYTVNKAISQAMKKKSFLPYKQGILGRLAFNPNNVHAFGSIA